MKEVSMLTISATPVPTPAPFPVALTALNAVAIDARQIEAALQRRVLLPAEQRGDPAAQAASFLAYARDASLADPTNVALALHARVAALDHWAATHDPAAQLDQAALHEAAARMPLSDGGDGAAFEAAGFQELLLFIEELPW
jgi:hypothetical protein